MTPEHNPNVVAEALARLTDGFQTTNTRAILAALLSEAQELEDVLFNVYVGRTLAAATLYDLPVTNSVLDAIGALIGQERLGMDDADYQAVLYLTAAVNRSRGVTADWSNFARILLQTAGGDVEYYTGYPNFSGAFFFFVGDMELPPIVVAGVLAKAVPPGIRGVFGYTTWPDGNDFEWGSVTDGSVGEGGWGTVTDGTAGGLMVAGQSLS